MLRSNRTLVLSGFIALQALLLFGCQSDVPASGADAGGTPNSGGCPSWSRERIEVVRGLQGVYRGSLGEFDGGAAPCSHDGKAFELTLELDPGSRCAQPTWCATEAFSCDLAGTLNIGDTQTTLSGRIYLLSGTSAGVSVELATSSVSDAGPEAGPAAHLEGLERSRKLGGVGSSEVFLHWAHDAGADPGDAVDVCVLKIEDAP